MLPRQNRLKHWRDFQTVYEQGKCHYGRSLVVRVLLDSDSSAPCPVTFTPSPLMGIMKIGIVIGKKVSKKAVVRNRIKRQIRAALRELLPQMNRGGKIVIGVKPQARECEYEHFLRELKQLLIKAEVLHGH